MKLIVKSLGFLTGIPVCIVHNKTLIENDIHIESRVELSIGSRKMISIVDGMSRSISKDEIILSEQIMKRLKLKDKDVIDVHIASRPHSIALIKKKLKGDTLSKKEIYEIIENIANNSLTEAEVSFFVSAVYSNNMTFTETKHLTSAMVDSGYKMHFPGKIVDKHCIGGVAGNRTTPLVVSICAAAGLLMPKTSSRAITSAAGTADTIESIAQVDFEIAQIKRIIKKTNACFVWGGALGLAPVDDKIIKIERIVNIDSTAQLLASILSKKISVGSKYILIDIPYGNSAKVSKVQAEKLAKKFYHLGRQFDLKMDVILTDGSEPIGRGIGPSPEISDIIRVLRREEGPIDLEEKSLVLAGRLLELAGSAKKNKGYLKAKEILESGLALKKFKQIISAQGGDIDFVPKPKYFHEIILKKKMKVKHLDNKMINKLARIAGSPEDKPAGLYLNIKKGEWGKKGDVLMTIFAESKEKLSQAKKFYKDNSKDIVKRF